MEKIEDLKEVLSEELYEDTLELLDIYANIRFDYLVMKQSAWEKLFIRTIQTMMDRNVSDKAFAGELCRLLNISLKNHICKRLKAGSIVVCSNLLMKLQRTYRDGIVLRNFVYEFEQLGISFMDEVFDLMKENSVFFKRLLAQVGLLEASKEAVAEYLNKEYKMDIKVGSLDKEEITTTTTPLIDLNAIEKYSNLTFEEIKALYGDSFHNLPNDSVQLLERFFSVPITDFCFSPYEAEKVVNLLLYNYKRKSTEIDPSILVDFYLKNKDKFKEDEALYLECFVFNLQDKSIFEQKFPEGVSVERSVLINKLEMLYYGIEDIFDYALTKEQYLSVLEKYPNEIEESIKNILDDYYGINTTALSIQGISKKYDMSYDDAKELIKKARKYCLSLYSNLSNSQKADPKIYMPYVLDRRYNLSDEAREVLELYFSGSSYEEIEKKTGKKRASSIVSVAIQKIDAYRFGVEKVKNRVEGLEVEVSYEDILLEIERHPSESVITVDEKKFLSYYLGVKNEYNPEHEQLSGMKLQERLNFKRNVSTRYRDILDKIKQRKIGNLEPEFIIIPRENLSEILMDPHLPITKEDRIIICSLLEINGYPFKTILELAEELGVTDKSIRRKYQIAIININKYLVGEKEGIIDYDVDIVPNLKYFTSKERELLKDYYVYHLNNKEIAKKYGLSKEKLHV